MGTKENPGKYDCYADAKSDEPLFTLLARDPLAPILVSLWAALREQGGEDLKKVTEARSCAVAMVRWRRQQQKRQEQDMRDRKETLAILTQEP